MDDERYSLQELADAAGVSVRTVRYYISEGLLPPPVQAGARSYYTRHQLDRLRLIGLLKDAFLPLKEIRRRLAAIGDEELRQALVDAGPEEARQRPESEPGPKPGPEVYEDLVAPPWEMPEPTPKAVTRAAFARSIREPDDEALDYINRVLGERHAPGRHLVPPRPAPPVHPSIPAPERTWRRLPIGEDAELVISDELYRRRKDRIDALITWAERMLTQD